MDQWRIKNRNELLHIWREKRCLTGSQYSEKLSSLRTSLLDFFNIQDRSEFTISLTDLRIWLSEQGYVRFMRHNFVYYQGIAVRRLLP